MNANELADELDVESSQAEYGYVVDNWELFRNAATMLRKQQAEIEALKHWQETWRLFLKEHFGIEK